jgi:hypothetical protein
MINYIKTWLFTTIFILFLIVIIILLCAFIEWENPLIYIDNIIKNISIISFKTLRLGIVVYSFIVLLIHGIIINNIEDADDADVDLYNW